MTLLILLEAALAAAPAFRPCCTVLDLEQRRAFRVKLLLPQIVVAAPEVANGADRLDEELKLA